MLQQIAADLSSALTGLEPQRLQACYRPVYDDGLPLLGQVPGVQGAYLANVPTQPPRARPAGNMIRAGRCASQDFDLW